MLAYLESHGHWGYIYASLAVTVILVLADLLPPWLRQRKLQNELRARARREQHRNP
ncbi:MAG TPA: heme exporter protein CcmD [Xanthomonadales bacterium]|nr:heme exporter protein CcmD [Xanthomonadales bacterium]